MDEGKDLCTSSLSIKISSGCESMQNDMNENVNDKVNFFYDKVSCFKNKLH